MRRRQFLGRLGTALGGLALGPAMLPRRGWAAGEAPWGDYPAAAASAQLAPEHRAESVLEIFLDGGVSPWETFYTVADPAYGQSDELMWWTFQDGPDSVPEWHARCHGASPLLMDFATDALGAEVKLGPFLEPLRRRSDIIERLRVHVLSHGLFPHDVAQATAQLGVGMTEPRAAGMGTMVQRYLATHGLAAEVGLPSTYIIGEASTFFAGFAGLHGSQHRPLTLAASGIERVASSLGLLSVLERERPRAPLRDLYARRYAERLTDPRTHELARTRVVRELQFALTARLQAAAAPDVLAAELTPGSTDACGSTHPLDTSRTQLQLAAFLLNQPDLQTRHVAVIDRAYDPIAVMNGAYDTHQAHVSGSSQKLTYFLERLVEVIAEPGDDDPTKINLDRTLVVLNTEFGRSPERQGEDGRNHYPPAYCTAMFGGPVGVAQRGIVGAIGPNAQAVGALSPADTRAGILTALGIYPFASEAFIAADIAGVADVTEAAFKAREVVLGVPA